jgi:hypothetical protein
MEIFKIIYDLGYRAGVPGDRNDSKGEAHVFCLREGKKPNGLANKSAGSFLSIKAGAELIEVQEEGAEIWNR